MRKHLFFHADRYRTLKEGQIITCTENNLSAFGEVYWNSIHTKPESMMTSEEVREYYLEKIRLLPKFSFYESRMRSLFAANTIKEAVGFAENIMPKLEHNIPIYEVYAQDFWTLDSNWLDYNSDHETTISNYNQYWFAAISNHRPESGDRRPPTLEVLLSLPVHVGKIVAWTNIPNKTLKGGTEKSGVL